MRLPVLVLVALFCACGAPEERVPEGSPRIISLAPAITEILVALGARNEIVGVDHYSIGVLGVPYPADVRSLGALFTPDLERTVELSPTLVIGVQSAQQSAFFQVLRSRGVRVETLSAHTLDEVLGSYETLGAWTGRAEAGEALRAEAEKELDQVRARHSGALRPVAIIVEREPLYVVGGGSFVSELVAIAGGRNVFADLDRPYPQVSVEVLVERAPPLIIDTTGGDPEHWRRFGWDGRVEEVPPEALTIPGVRLPELALRLFSLIDPERR